MYKGINIDNIDYAYEIDVTPLGNYVNYDELRQFNGKLFERISDAQRFLENLLEKYNIDFFSVPRPNRGRVLYYYDAVLVATIDEVWPF